MTTELDTRVPARIPYRWATLVVVLAALFMDLVDATIVNIVLPEMRSDLGADPSAAQWVLAGYSLTFALTLITGGRLGDVVGRKRIFLIGIAGFVLTSVACGAAPTAGILIAARLVQGVMAALMVPQAMSVIVVTFAAGERARALAFYGLTLSLANVSGPALGAVLAEADVFGLGWRTIFYVNIPIGLAAFAAGLVLMSESKASRPLGVDLTGMVLGAAATVTLLYPLVQGADAGWPMWMWPMPVAALGLLAVFAAQQRRRDRRDGSALVPPVLVRYRSFTAGIVVLLVVFSGLASLFLVLAFDLQAGRGWTPLATAAAITAWPIGITATTGLAQRFAAGHARRMIRIGLALMIVGALWLIELLGVGDPDLRWWHVGLPVLVAGLGMGMSVPILTGVVLAEVPGDHAGAASGVANAIVQLGTAVGVAIVGAIFFWLVGDGGAAEASRGQVYASAAATTLSYNAGAFLLALLLTPLLPRTTASSQ